jgi:hypothetical protein
MVLFKKEFPISVLLSAFFMDVGLKPP